MRKNPLLYVASFAFMIGVGSVVATLPVLLRNMHAGEVEASLAVTVWGLVYLLSNIPAGVLADKIGANRIIPVAFLLNFPIGLLMYFGKTIIDYTVARALEGFLEALIWTGVIGLAVKDEEKSKLMGVSGVYAAIALGFTLGPVLSSIIASISQRLPLLFYSAGSFTAFIVTLPLLKASPVKVSKPPIKLKLNLAAWLSLMTAFTIGLTESLIVVYAPVLAFESGYIESQLIVSIYYLMGLLGQISIRFLHNHVMMDPYLLSALLLSGIVALGSQGPLIPIAIGLLGFFNAQLSSRAQAKVAEHMRGVESTGAGITNFAWSLGYFLGAPLYSALNPGTFEPQTAVGVVLLGVLCFYTSLFLRNRRGAIRANA
ncbi:MAG: MFS transporter [Infirmifilum sp.]